MKRALMLPAVLCIAGAVGAYAQNDYTILHDFAGGPGDGAEPCGRPLLDGGSLYGLTTSGGNNSIDGTIYSIDTSGSGYTLLHKLSFANGEGVRSEGGLVSNGSALYGTASIGGYMSRGTVFSFDTSTNTLNAHLHDFADSHVANDGEEPVGGLVLLNGLLYGMTNEGGTGGGINGMGVIFSLKPDGSAYTILHNFTGPNPAGDGSYPRGDLVTDGNALYGMTSYGGSNHKGTIFSLKPDGSGYSIIHDFSDSPGNGSFPLGGLILKGDALYGMTVYGGTDGRGCVFSIGTDGGGFTILHSFAGGTDDGRNPNGGLVSNGSTLYGMTEHGGYYDSYGGAFGNGVMFSVGADGSAYTVLHTFTGFFGAPVPDGYHPTGSLASDGSALYGTTKLGGYKGAGTLFKYTLPKNYVELTASPVSVSGGSAVSMNWSCDFSTWDYRNVPVNIYVAAIKTPKAANGPSSVADALAGGTVYLAADGMSSWYPYSGSVGAPTWSAVAFPPAPTTGTKTLTTPSGAAFTGDWVFATAFIKADGSGYVRTDLPVENSNQFQIQ